VDEEQERWEQDDQLGYEELQERRQLAELYADTSPALSELGQWGAVQAAKDSEVQAAIDADADYYTRRDRRYRQGLCPDCGTRWDVGCATCRGAVEGLAQRLGVGYGAAVDYYRARPAPAPTDPWGDVPF
jgi:hypothetical protein